LIPARLVIDATLTWCCHANCRGFGIDRATANGVRVSAKAVTREQIDSLELNGRNRFGLPLWFLALAGPRWPISTSASPRALQILTALAIRNLITFDGAQLRARAPTELAWSADVDSTQEVQILTTDYAPEYVGLPARRFALPPRRTSQFHGAMYEYLRNTPLNANTWRAMPTPTVSPLLRRHSL